MSLEPDDDDLSVVAGYLAQTGFKAGAPAQAVLEAEALGEPTSVILVAPGVPPDSPTGLSQAASSPLADDDLLTGML